VGGLARETRKGGERKVGHTKSSVSTEYLTGGQREVEQAMGEDFRVGEILAKELRSNSEM